MFGIEQEGCEFQLVELSPPRYIFIIFLRDGTLHVAPPPSGHLNIAPPRCRAAVAALAQCISPGPRQGGEGRGKRSGQWRAGKFGVFCVTFTISLTMELEFLEIVDMLFMLLGICRKNQNL